MKKLLTYTTAALLSLTVFAAISCSTPTSANTLQSTAKVETVNLALTGLHGAVGCPPRVQAALLKVKGVASAEVTKTNAKVVIDRNRVTNEQLIMAVKGAGKTYNATVK